MNTITIYKNQIIHKLNDVLYDMNETILNSMEYIREQLCTCGVIERRADLKSLLPLIAVLLMAFTAFVCLLIYLIFKFKCFVYKKTVDVHDLVAPHSKRMSSKNSSQTALKSQSRPQSISTGSTDHSTHQTQDNSSNDKTNHRSYSSDNITTASPTLPIIGDIAIPVSKSDKSLTNGNSKEAANACETSNNYDIVLPDTPLIPQQISESKHLIKSKSLKSLNSNQSLDNCRSESLESIVAIDSSDSSVDITQFIDKNDKYKINSSDINNFDVKARVCDIINQNTEHSNKRRGDEFFECFDSTQNCDGMSMHVSPNHINHFEFELSATETGDKEDNKLDVNEINLTVNNDNEDSNKKAVTPDASLHNDDSRVPSACSSKSDQTFQSSSKESRSLLKSIRKRMSFNKNKPITYRNHETLPKDNNENASIELSSKKKSFRQSFNSLNAFQSSSSSSKDRSILKSIRKRMSFNKNRPITDQNSETIQKENNETTTTVKEDT